MMKMQKTNPDVKLLSTYLDGQLTLRKRDRLEARLNNEPDLQMALSELRRTRNLLRSVPRLRAPRNFMLTPEMAGQRRSTGIRLYPAFRFASVIASFLLVAVVALDYLGGISRLTPSLDEALPQVALMEEKEIPKEEIAAEAPVAEMVVEEVPAEMTEEIILEAVPPDAFVVEAEVEIASEEETGDIAGIAGGESRAFTPVPEQAEEEMVDAMKMVEEEGEPEGEPSLLEADAAQSEVSLPEAPGEEAAASEPIVGQDEVSQGVVSEVDESETFDSLEQAPLDRNSEVEEIDGFQDDVFTPMAAEDIPIEESEPRVHEQEPTWYMRSQRSFLRIAEILLAILALGMGGLAYYFRRRA
jgi:anti-sigma factor RsiW